MAKRKRSKKSGNNNPKSTPKTGSASCLNEANVLSAIWQKICNKKTVIITGAGISVGAGIPCFTGKNGLYDRPDGDKIKRAWTIKDGYGPVHGANLHLFYAQNRQFYLSSPKPTDIHRVIKSLQETHNIDIITMNIDNLHELAGSEVLHIHGKIQQPHVCVGVNCDHETDIKNIQNQLKNNETVPICGMKKCDNKLFPPVIFYGMSTYPEETKKMARLLNECEHIIVIGSSLTVNPIARSVTDAINNGKTLTIINRDETPLDKLATHRTRDIDEFTKYMNDKLRDKEDEEITFNPKKFRQLQKINAAPYIASDLKNNQNPYPA